MPSPRENGATRKSSSASSLEKEVGIKKLESGAPLQKRCNRFLHSSLVEYGMSIVILANFVVIIIETDARAKYEDGVGDGVPAWISISSWFVLVIFVVEMAMRLYSERSAFFTDSWNVFDMIIIFIDAMFSVITVLFGNLFPVSILRILRLAKVTRISKVFRIFPELRLMLAGLLGAMRSILWGTALMGIAFVLFSVIAVQFIHPLNRELAKMGVHDDCDRCGHAFSSVSLSILTLCQQVLVGDGWQLLTIPLIEEYPATALFFGTCYLLIAFAVHNLILGVIVDVAQESRKELMHEIERRRIAVRKDGEMNLLQICMSMDTDNSGNLSKDELFAGYSDYHQFREAVSSLEVGANDLEIIWLLLDRDKSGQIDYSEFVTEVYNMKNSDTNFMLAYIKYYITQIRDHIMEEMNKVETELNQVREAQQEIIELEHETVGGIESMQKTAAERATLRRSLRSSMATNSGIPQEMLRENSSAQGSVNGSAIGSVNGSAIASANGSAKEIANGIAPNAAPPRELSALSAALSTGSVDCFIELLVELRNNQSKIMARFDEVDAKVAASLSENIRTNRNLGIWPGPSKIIAQVAGQKGSSPDKRNASRTLEASAAYGNAPPEGSSGMMSGPSTKAPVRPPMASIPPPGQQ